MGNRVEKLERGLTPEIRLGLNTIVNYVAKYLSELMGVDFEDIRSPNMVLDSNGWYCYESKILALTLGSMKKYSNFLIGHETAHHVHNVKNPEILRDYPLPEPTNLVELVAYYGAHIFANDKHPQIEYIKQMVVMEAKKSKRLVEMLKPREEFEEKLRHYWESHKGGGEAARFLFINHGQRYFEEMASADLDKAKTLLKRLGYRGSLFVPWEANSYIEVNPKGQQVEVIGRIHVPEAPILREAVLRI